jgi:hypothetical protein
MTYGELCGGIAPVFLDLWTLYGDKWLAARSDCFVSRVSALDNNWTGDCMGNSVRSPPSPTGNRT